MFLKIQVKYVETKNIFKEMEMKTKQRIWRRILIFIMCLTLLNIPVMPISATQSNITKDTTSGENSSGENTSGDDNIGDNTDGDDNPGDNNTEDIKTPGEGKPPEDEPDKPGDGDEKPGDGDEKPEEPEAKILMIGNSFTKRSKNLYGVDTILTEIAKANGKNIKVSSVTNGGAYLSYYAFWSEGYKDYFESLIEALKEDQYDYVIIQEQTKAAVEKYEDQMLPAAQQLYRIIRSYQPKTTLLLYETAAYTDGTKTLTEGVSRVLTMQEFQERLLYGHTRLKDTLVVDMIPAGMLTYHSSQVYPSINMVSSDLRHPSYAGYYIAAAATYYKIFGKVPQIKKEDLKKCDLNDSQLEALSNLVVDKMNIGQSRLNLKRGESRVLSTTISAPVDRAGTLFFKSLNPEIAVVDATTGVVTGINEGTTGILAETTTGLMVACMVTVENIASPILGFGQDIYQVMVGDTLKILPRALNWNVGDTYKWSSSDNTVATISLDGTVTTRKMGVAVIEVRSSLDKNLRASYRIHVKGKPPEALTATVSKVTAKGGSVTLSWKPVYGATKYQIYRKDSLKGTYRVIGTADTNSYIDQAPATDVNCYYKVSAIAGGVFTESNQSNEAKILILSATEAKVEKITRKYVKISWLPNPGAKGYIIYRSTKKYSGYKQVKKIMKKTQTSFVDRKVQKKKRYYYKIKAYKKVNGTFLYSVFSNRIQAKVPKK